MVCDKGGTHRRKRNSGNSRKKGKKTTSSSLKDKLKPSMKGWGKNGYKKYVAGYDDLEKETITFLMATDDFTQFSA